MGVLRGKAARNSRHSTANTIEAGRGPHALSGLGHALTTVQSGGVAEHHDHGARRPDRGVGERRRTRSFIAIAEQVPSRQ